MRWLSGPRWERKLTVAAVMVVLLGIAAVAALVQRAAPAPAPVEAEASEPRLPLAGWRILVDAGHGGYDGGAKARSSGVWEKEINLAVAKQVEKALTARGAVVLMTRTEDEDLCTASRPAGKTMKREDMERRVALAAEGKADMVLSIHMNEYRSRRESGPQVFYRQGCDSGRLLAGAMQQALITCLAPKKERAAMAGDYFILQLDVPSVLIECGFLSNAEEEKLLLSPEYQAKLGSAIAQGVEEYAALAQGLR